MDWFSSWFNTKYYHLLYNNRDESEAALFINNLTKKINLKQGAKCWDLCCGRGRHSLSLNQLGFEVIGTDLSFESITAAKQLENNTLSFFQMDMREPFYINYFDLVTNLFTSFGYFSSARDDEKVFNHVQHALKPGGYFIVDYFNANGISDSQLRSGEKEVNGVYFKWHKKKENKKLYKYIEVVDSGEKFHFKEEVCLLHKSDFLSYANSCGLKCISCFGDYQLNEFDEINSPRLILLFKK